MKCLEQIRSFSSLLSVRSSREIAAKKSVLRALLSSTSLGLLPAAALLTTGILKKDTPLPRPDRLEQPTTMHSTIVVLEQHKLNTS